MPAKPGWPLPAQNPAARPVIGPIPVGPIPFPLGISASFFFRVISEHSSPARRDPFPCLRNRGLCRHDLNRGLYCPPRLQPSVYWHPRTVPLRVPSSAPYPWDPFRFLLALSASFFSVFSGQILAGTPPRNV